VSATDPAPETPVLPSGGSGVHVSSVPVQAASTHVPCRAQPSSDEGFSWRRLALAASPLAAAYGVHALGVPLCPTKAFFGVPCPGCGMTRATECLLHLDFAGMWRFHPLAFVISPLVAWWVTAAVLGAAGVASVPRWDPGKLVPRGVWMGLGMAVLGLYVLRLGGWFGGLPDPVDPASGLLGRSVGFALGAMR
jgi:hypothetical protein